MARLKKAPQGTQDRVGDFRHDEARRVNNPHAGIAIYEARERQTTRYAYDPHLDPQLVWAGKAEHTSFEMDVVSLHIHERISSRAILDAVRRLQLLQLEIFGETPSAINQLASHSLRGSNELAFQLYLKRKTPYVPRNQKAKGEC